VASSSVSRPSQFLAQREIAPVCGAVGRLPVFGVDSREQGGARSVNSVSSIQPPFLDFPRKSASAAFSHYGGAKCTRGGVRSSCTRCRLTEGLYFARCVPAAGTNVLAERASFADTLLEHHIYQG